MPIVLETNLIGATMPEVGMSPRGVRVAVAILLSAGIPLGVAPTRSADEEPAARSRVRRHLQRSPVAMAGPTLAGCPIFPVSNVWNTRIDLLPIDPRSADYINAIGPAIATGERCRWRRTRDRAAGSSSADRVGATPSGIPALSRIAMATRTPRGLIPTSGIVAPIKFVSNTMGICSLCPGSQMMLLSEDEDY